MSRHAGRMEYALCDYRDEWEHRCRAFILPEPHGDPMGPGAVLAGYLDITQAAESAEWLTTADEGDWCPAHKGLVLAARGRAAIKRAEADAALLALRKKLTGEPGVVHLPGGEAS